MSSPSLAREAFNREVECILAKHADDEARFAALTTVVDDLFIRRRFDCIKAVVHNVLNDEAALAPYRWALLDHAIQKLIEVGDDSFVDVGTYMLDEIRLRQSEFELEVISNWKSKLSLQMSKRLKRDGSRQVEDANMTNTDSRAYTEEEVMVHRGRFFDAAKKYFDAATAYDTHITASTESTSDCNPVTAESNLLRAALCILLAPPTAQRKNIVAAMCNHEGTKQCPLYSLLLRLHNNKFVHPHDWAEVENFIIRLRLPVPLAPGNNVLTKTALLQNILAASSVFCSMELTTLSKFCDSDVPQVEDAIAELILDKQVEAQIDQHRGMVFFKAASRRVEALWDAEIDEMTSAIDSVCEAVVEKFPHLSGLSSKESPGVVMLTPSQLANTTSC